MSKKEINKYRQQELYYFCLQYDEWEKILKCEIGTPTSTNLFSIRSKGRITDITGNSAIKRMKYSQNIDIINNTLEEVGGNMSEWLYLGIIKDYKFYQLEGKGIPCGKNTYYKMRKKFYAVLDEKLKDRDIK